MTSQHQQHAQISCQRAWVERGSGQRAPDLPISATCVQSCLRIRGSVPLALRSGDFRHGALWDVHEPTVCCTSAAEGVGSNPPL